MARQNPADELRDLNQAAREGRLDIVEFLESNFFVPGSLFRARPIKFEPWQTQNVILPVINRRETGKDVFLNGMAKKDGKSTLSACVASCALLLDDYFPEVYSAAGDFDQARIIFRNTVKSFERGPLSRFVKIYRDVIERIDGNGFYRVLASDAPGSHGLNASCTLWDELWNQPDYSLWEALTHSPTREAAFHFITTYAGFQARTGNLLWDLYSRGLAGDDPRMYMYWLSGDDANPASWITPEYLASQRKRLPDHIFRRLHRNEWSVAEDTKVFRIPAECWEGAFEDYIPGNIPVHCYSIGIDLAKSRDYTAWAVIRIDVEPKRLVDFGKLPHIDYTEQVKMLAAMCGRFGNPHAVVDAGAAGTAVIELMEQAGMNVEPFTFTSNSKAEIVTQLAVAFEQRKLLLPKAGRSLEESRIVSDLETELFNFEPTVLRSGNIRYEAAGGGYFDDLVMALCMAYSGAEEKDTLMCEFIECGPGAPQKPPGQWWLQPPRDEERLWRRTS